MRTLRKPERPSLALVALAMLLGTITDRTTGQPLPGVRVTLRAAHAVTAADGSYTLRNVKPGKATLDVSSDDVPPQQFPVTVRGATTHLDLRVCSTTLDYHCAGP